ncbi:protein mraZ [Gardnerella pickettii 00703Bmash]|uniref:Transcriptional regulator MraZ n=1 Tax=Gardnerella pickettii TaxID=2914924 RepID=A0ABX4SGI9_9BIFI|nr:division/cell wall cluster transcriptional repressor MraZ [Gardnerella pickettii]EIK84530.1 protein mraZ [Gardnerella pickettii 00703Bmash]PKZ53127.1 transcriptional regulator MraZ [Gardnerella pickettii]
MASNNAGANAQDKANSSFKHAQNPSGYDSQNTAQANAQDAHMPMQNSQAYAQPYYVIPQMPQMYQAQQVPQMPVMQPVMQSQPTSSAFTSTPLPQDAVFGDNNLQSQANNHVKNPILLGTYSPKIDAKGRVALPAKFRSQLGNGFVMARGQERCVYVLPMQEFERITTQIQLTSMSNKSARDYLRVFLSGAVDQEPDKQGRIVVPPMLRDYANLGDEIVVIGVGTRAEIWNKSAWNNYLADKEQDYADIANDVLPAVAQ